MKLLTIDCVAVFPKWRGVNEAVVLKNEQDKNPESLEQVPYK